MANLKFKRNDRVRVIIGGKEGVILNDSPKYIDEVRRKNIPGYIRDILVWDIRRRDRYI